MVAGSKTIESAIKVLLRHLDRKKALAIIGELKQVKGNKSFTETMRLLHERLKLVDS